LNSLAAAGVEPGDREGSFFVPRQFGLKAKPATPRRSKANELKANDLEGQMDMGGKQGGQAGMPKPPSKPRATRRDGDVVTKRASTSRHS
jgi:hypothetical protein